MPAPKRLYMNSREISGVTGVSLREAQDLLCMFEQQGNTIRSGRSRLVSVDAFAMFLCGDRPDDYLKRKYELQDVLMEYDREKRKSERRKG